MASGTTAPTFELNDGNQIPVIALGTNKIEGEEMRLNVNDAVEVGFRHIDTAFLYNNEEDIGKGINDVIEKGLVKREDLFITTKLWYMKNGRDEVLSALREALGRLGLEYVDLCLIHIVGFGNEDGSLSDEDIQETWKGMEEAKNQDLAKSIGVWNFDTEQVKRVIENGQIPPAVNQIEVHPAHTREALVSDMEELGVRVIAYSPLGFLVDRGQEDAPAPHIDDPELTEIAEKYGKTTTQVVLRYLIDRGTIPCTKSSQKEHLEKNIDIFDFSLTPEEVAIVNKFNVDKTVFNPEDD
ncbi:unnamed protein product [Chilo suppressalis]|uniref:NADP-dependent oxidoreductase domain-containing protein n=1 Tax=Chilo suppressalis TaxID=168631 RepID=A0ABN8B1M9_CHISP|nr:unnamed protein product [Chilo suppressalis]